MSLARLFVTLLILFLVGMAFRWEECDYRDSSGATAFRYQGLLLPWQEATAPPAGVHVASVAVHRWSFYGLNRFDSVGDPGPDAVPVRGTRVAWR